MRIRKVMIVPVGTLLSVSAWLMATPAQHQADTFAEFDPRPLIWLNENERHSLVRRSEEPGVQMAFAPLRLSADRALARSPNPIAEIIYEGHVGNHPSRIRTVAHLQDIAAMESRRRRIPSWKAMESLEGLRCIDIGTTISIRIETLTRSVNKGRSQEGRLVGDTH